MSDWVPAILGDLVEIRHGFAFKGEYFRDAPPGNILLTPGNFAIGGGFQFGKIKFYDGPPSPGYFLEAGDLLVTMTDLSKAGDTLGYPAIVPDDGSVYLHNQRLGKVVMVSDQASRDFIYWLMRTREYRAEILASCTGSTVKHTSPSRIKAFRFLLPSRIEQGLICETLNSLDDKIELNRRINETLEAMAQAIFRDWFIEFGPTRRKIDGASDPVAIMGGLVADPDQARELADLFPARLREDGLPEGWEERRLEEVASQHTSALTPHLYPDENFVHYSIPAFDKERNPSLEAGTTIRSNKTIVPPDAVLLSKLNPEIARVWLPDQRGDHRAISSTEFLAYTARKPFGRTLLYALFESALFRELLCSMVTGTSKSHQRVSPKALAKREVLAASPAVAQEFEAIAGPLLERVQHNRTENRTLAATRDLLLPKLMSGEIRLGDAETELERVA